eukprot:352193-Chlamydomonas_euryale.AAC.2
MAMSSVQTDHAVDAFWNVNVPKNAIVMGVPQGAIGGSQKLERSNFLACLPTLLAHQPMPKRVDAATGKALEQVVEHPQTDILKLCCAPAASAGRMLPRACAAACCCARCPGCVEARRLPHKMALLKLSCCTVIPAADFLLPRHTQGKEGCPHCYKMQQYLASRPTTPYLYRKYWL